MDQSAAFNRFVKAASKSLTAVAAWYARNITLARRAPASLAAVNSLIAASVGFTAVAARNHARSAFA